jgi:hypothetical protein
MSQLQFTEHEIQFEFKTQQKTFSFLRKYYDINLVNFLLAYKVMKNSIAVFV